MGSNGSSLPLAGVRVLDMSQALAGPFGSRILGDLGAEVLKIEQPGIGDSSRRFPPYYLEGRERLLPRYESQQEGPDPEPEK